MCSSSVIAEWPWPLQIMVFELAVFFVSEMAERHKAKQVLKIARDLIHKLQTLIENK